MRSSVTVLAPAKLNLALDVVGILPGGYHALDMTMQAISLYERVVIRRSPYLDLTLPGSKVKAGPGNTAIKAALAFFHYTGLLAGADITIYKNVPVRAGMAGGSADAAAVLVGLNELYGAAVHERAVRAGGVHRRGRALRPHGRHLPGAGPRRCAQAPAAPAGVLVHGGHARLRRLHP